MDQQKSEELLIQRAVEGDKDAFADLCDRYLEQVYRHVYYRVFNRTDSEDITQEVFIKAWKAIHKYKRTGAPFVAWLIAIARNHIVDYYKGKKKHVSLEEAETASNSADTNPEAMAEATINSSYVRKAVLRLKGDKQKVILMHFIDGFSYEEIARIINKSEGAVRVIQYRALNDLRRILVQSI